MPNLIKRVDADDTLLLTYSISSADSVLEGNIAAAPIEYKMGTGLWPMLIEFAMHNEHTGAELNINIKASEHVFGTPDLERVLQLDLIDFDQNPDIGELVEFELPDGKIIEGQVLSQLNDKLEVDFNHPYVGRDLKIYIKIESIL